MDDDRPAKPNLDKAREDFLANFPATLDAAAGPLKRMAAITAQVGLARIPADASCHCLCSIFEPHACEGWRADGCIREIPGGTLFGRALPATVVPLCRGCVGAVLRSG